MILEIRMRIWIEFNSIIHEAQAGFRNNDSTVSVSVTTVFSLLCQKYTHVTYVCESHKSASHKSAHFP